ATKRKEYDEVRKLGPSAFNTGNGGGGGFGFSSDDLGDLIGNLFGRGRNRGAGSGRFGGGAGPQRGADLETELHLSFLDAVNGITINVPITFAEAALGAEVTVPTLDDPVTLRIPPGTRSGRTFRVKGRGVPAPKGVGDLLVTAEVAVPTELSPAEREAIEALQ